MATDPDWRTGHCAEPAVERLKQAAGRDLWAELGGVPRSPRQAAAVFRQLGVTNLKDAVTAVLGPPVDRKLARRGDVALIASNVPGFWALGIVRGEWVECIDLMQPLSRVECAWHVN